LIPAHVWTPWFSVLGSKSGFDTIDECYGDLADQVFALETGLSSDPAMNRRLSQLDRYTLVSNSDAHSPPKIGREACVFATDIDYFAMLRALQTGRGYDGTVEIFPEEGKYHLDGHRKCGVRLSPEETRASAGLCPECGKGVTVGVMNRVDELADRPDDSQPDDAKPFRSLVPLAEIISEVRGVGEKSKKVQQAHNSLISRIGSELFILEHAPVEDILNAGSPLVAEAIRRMRDGRVHRQAGFDGEYGRIRLFEEGELTRGAHVSLLFEIPKEEQPSPQDSPPDSWPAEAAEDAMELMTDKPLPRVADDDQHEPGATGTDGARSVPAFSVLDQLDADQRAAAEITDGPLLIVAGPGTGKTRTLTHRIAHLVIDCDVAPEQCLAITFSRRAASEMTERLAGLLPGLGARIPVMTFHALGLTILRENSEQLDLPEDFHVADEEHRLGLLAEYLAMTQRQVRRALRQISEAKRTGDLQRRDPQVRQLMAKYDQLLREHKLLDFEDLILLPVTLLEREPDLAESYRRRWPQLSVDEFQDMDGNQYRLVRQLATPDGNICVIGDPDQSIYGFRGSDPGIFLRFAEDFPTAKSIQLTRNYRSSQTIVDAALQAIAPSSLLSDRSLDALSDAVQRIQIHTSPTERAEAEFVVHRIERLIGGSTFFSMDSGRVETHEGDMLSFSDVAVLYRTETQADALIEAFSRSGIPFQKKSHRGLAEEPAIRAIMQTVQRLSHRLKKEARPADLCELLKRAADEVWDEHPEVADYLAQLFPLAARCENNVPRFLSDLSMGVDIDSWDPRADRVSLLTIHASKGLEFPVVFLVGCEDGILPLRWGGADDGDQNEERRLFFVGITRAGRRLFLTHARRRKWRGKVREMSPSPFLEQIQEELVERAEQQRKAKKKGSTDAQLQLF
jgi:DNA helicase-2/ATP-dependent DNA helicase PcrA